MLHERRAESTSHRISFKCTRNTPQSHKKSYGAGFAIRILLFKDHGKASHLSQSFVRFFLISLTTIEIMILSVPSSLDKDQPTEQHEQVQIEVRLDNHNHSIFVNGNDESGRRQQAANAAAARGGRPRRRGRLQKSNSSLAGMMLPSDRTSLPDGRRRADTGSKLPLPLPLKRGHSYAVNTMRGGRRQRTHRRTISCPPNLCIIKEKSALVALTKPPKHHARQASHWSFFQSSASAGLQSLRMRSAASKVIPVFF